MEDWEPREVHTTSESIVMRQKNARMGDARNHGLFWGVPKRSDYPWEYTRGILIFRNSNINT